MGLTTEAQAAQAAAILAFVLKERQDRWLRAIESPGKAKRNPVKLADPWEFDRRWLTEVDRASHTAAGIVTLLRSYGAADRAWVMTTAYPADEHALEVAVRQALDEVCALVICAAGHPLAYLRTEVGDGFVLARKD